MLKDSQGNQGQLPDKEKRPAQQRARNKYNMHIETVVNEPPRQH